MHCVLREKRGLLGQKRTKTEAGDSRSVKKQSAEQVSRIPHANVQRHTSVCRELVAAWFVMETSVCVDARTNK